MQRNLSAKHILISRTDSVGDVVLTLPVCGYLKSLFPECKISFLGQSYTEAIIKRCKHVDAFIDWEKISSNAAKEFQNLNIDVFFHVFPVKEIAKAAKNAGVKERVGTKSRLYHWLTCNRLISLPRKNSDLHEAQLNIKLINSYLGKPEVFPFEEIHKFYGFNAISHAFPELISDKKKVVLHVGSRGSARDWPVKNFSSLKEKLLKYGCQVILTGTEKEKETLFPMCPDLFSGNVTDMMGKCNMQELISLLDQVDIVVANSTGPLHIAAALGKSVLGIYPPIRPMHPGRWAPLGEKATYIVKDKSCEDCRKGGKCQCVEEIDMNEVFNEILKIGI